MNLGSPSGETLDKPPASKETIPASWDVCYKVPCFAQQWDRVTLCKRQLLEQSFTAHENITNVITAHENTASLHRGSSPAGELGSSVRSQPSGQVEETLTGLHPNTSKAVATYHLPFALRLKNSAGPWGGKGFRGPGPCSPGLTYLLHEHVDVGLCRIQHVAVRVPQPLDRDVHGFTIYVDPSSCPRGQEQPGTGRERLAKAAKPSQQMKSSQPLGREGST